MPALSCRPAAAAAASLQQVVGSVPVLGGHGGRAGDGADGGRRATRALLRRAAPARAPPLLAATRQPPARLRPEIRESATMLDFTETG